uniref:Uncharacterized protein n=1 Tax=Poecilia latipinna TaxID=48699 RepID=A0A3B3W2I7_9TELE
MRRWCAFYWSPEVCSLGWTNSPSYLRLLAVFSFDPSFISTKRLTSMCCKVKMTGSLINTRLDSLLIEAAMMSELTATVTLRPFLYSTKTSLATPAE